MTQGVSKVSSVGEGGGCHDSETKVKSIIQVFYGESLEV